MQRMFDDFCLEMLFLAFFKLLWLDVLLRERTYTQAWVVSCRVIMGFHRNAQARLRHLSYAAPVFVDITRSVYQVNNVTSSEPESLRMDRAYAVYDRVFWACLLWCVLFCIDLSTDAFKTTCLILYDSVCESAPRMVKGLWSRRTRTPRCFSCACRSWSGRSARQVCHWFVSACCCNSAWWSRSISWTASWAVQRCVMIQFDLCQTWSKYDVACAWRTKLAKMSGQSIAG